jgi:2-methylisocitrate lyase-like PEP mutase family enzyme
VVVIPNSTAQATAWTLRGMREGPMKEGSTKHWRDTMIEFDESHERIGLNKAREREEY